MPLDFQTLTDNELFDGLSAETLEDFFEIAQRNTIEPDTEIITEGEKEHGFYFIHSGKVHVLKRHPEGEHSDHSPVYVATLEEGESFGEMSLFTDNAVSASVVSRSKLSVSYFSKEKLEQFFEENEQTGFQFILNVKNLVSRRARSTTEALTELKASEGIVDDQELQELLEGLEYYSYV